MSLALLATPYFCNVLCALILFYCRDITNTINMNTILQLFFPTLFPPIFTIHNPMLFFMLFFMLFLFTCAFNIINVVHLGSIFHLTILASYITTFAIFSAFAIFSCIFCELPTLCLVLFLRILHIFNTSYINATLTLLPSTPTPFRLHFRILRYHGLYFLITTTLRIL